MMPLKVTVFPCDTAVNESELLAIEHLKQQLQIVGGTDEWILLTNLAFSVTHQFQPDEIDIIAIRPPGVRVIEVKHWSAVWVGSSRTLSDTSATSSVRTLPAKMFVGGDVGTILNLRSQAL